MYVFVDESGDAGVKFKQGSTAQMTVALIIFADEHQVLTADERITALRFELRKPASFEFHFASNSDQIREAFFNAIAPLAFHYTAMIIDKSRLYTEGYDSKQFYKDICGLVFEQSKPLLQNANVKIDKSGGQDFRRELIAHLKRVGNSQTECHIKQVAMKESRGNNLLQMADMICGAVARSYREEKGFADQYRKIIAHRESAVRLWPD